MSTDTRVVITGMGWVTPLGHGVDAVWKKLLRGESGIKPIERFNAKTFPSTFAAQVNHYDYRDFVVDPEQHEHANANSQYALGAAHQAWHQSGLGTYGDLDPTRSGIYLGAGEGVLDFDNYAKTDLASWDPDAKEIDTQRWIKAALANLDPWREIEQESNMPASHLAREYNLRGPTFNCLTACAASTQAIGEAFCLLKRGDADVMVAGGTHTMIHVLGVTGFNRLTALSTRNDDITGASRPFSRSRDGFVLGEGSGILVLETLEFAQHRGAIPLAVTVPAPMPSVSPICIPVVAGVQRRFVMPWSKRDSIRMPRMNKAGRPYITSPRTAPAPRKMIQLKPRRSNPRLARTRRIFPSAVSNR